jgi:hypothetical protein
MSVMLGLALLYLADPAPLYLADPAPLQPSDKWMVQYVDPDCLLSRPYGSGVDQVTLLVSPSLLGGEGVLNLVHPGSKALIYSGGKGTLTAEPGGPLAERKFAAGPTTVGKRLVSYAIDAEGMTRLSKAQTVRIPVEKGKIYVLATPRLGAALDALETCTQQQLKRLGVDAVALGIDKASRAKAVVPAVPKFQMNEIIRQEDYLAEALRNEQQGKVGIAWWVETDGKVRECRVILPSPSSLLNGHSCDLILRRAQYEPARDGQGNPIRSVLTTRFVWALPEWQLTLDARAMPAVNNRKGRRWSCCAPRSHAGHGSSVRRWRRVAHTASRTSTRRFLARLAGASLPSAAAPKPAGSWLAGMAAAE